MTVLRISITGPESTGKSMLAEQLAKHFSAIYVPEVARSFLEKLGRSYTFEDIVLVAKEQLRLENQLAAKADKYLFCDTDLLVTKIWSEFKYGKCDPWILREVNAHIYDLYLLCNTDLPWEYDPLRENQDEREELFKIYKTELEKMGVNFKVISGTGGARLRRAILAVEETFSF